MMNAAFFINILCHLSVLAAFITGLTGEELVIKLPHATSGLEDKCTFPEVLSIELSSLNQRREWNIELKRNNVIPTVRSVYFMTETTTTGMEEVHIDSGEHDGIQGYHNQHHGAAFIVRCKRGGINRPYFLLEGSVFVEEKKYRIQPSPTRRLDEKVSTHHMTVIYSMTEIDEFKAQDSAATFPSDADFAENVDHGKDGRYRWKRDVTYQATYNIDVLPVVDTTLYLSFYNMSAGNRTLAARNIADYLSNLFTGVNMRMDTLALQGRTLQIRMINPVLLTAQNQTPYYGAQLDYKDGLPSISATTLLNLFKDWLAKNTSKVGAYDHAMFLTALDITGGGDSELKYNITSGLAYVGTMCKTNGESSSIIEDKGAYQNEGVAAHELAHSFGSLHDGQNNSCHSSDNFVMADSTYEKNDANMFNPWKFSSCSANYIVKLLQELESNATKLQKCLRDSIGSNVTEYHTISADEQCKIFYGNQSFVCRGAGIPSLGSLCDEFYCRIPGTSRCERLIAATGTCCGNQKKCIRGVCVSAALGDCPMDEVCPLGDQQGIVLNNKTCAQLESQSCYDKDINLRCCATCKKFWTGNQGCSYGDKQKGCKERDCGSYFTSGDFLNMSYAFICCATCKNNCTDKHNVQIKDLFYSCDDYILTRGNRYICYTQEMHRESCCKSCEDARNASDPDCSWGDRRNCSSLLKQPKGFRCNSTQLHDCCKTCPALVTNVTTTVTILSTATTKAATTKAATTTAATTKATTRTTAVSIRQISTCNSQNRTSCRASNIVFEHHLCVLTLICFFLLWKIS